MNLIFTTQEPTMFINYSGPQSKTQHPSIRRAVNTHLSSVAKNRRIQKLGHSGSQQIKAERPKRKKRKTTPRKEKEAENCQAIVKSPKKQQNPLDEYIIGGNALFPYKQYQREDEFSLKACYDCTTDRVAYFILSADLIRFQTYSCPG